MFRHTPRSRSRVRARRVPLASLALLALSAALAEVPSPAAAQTLLSATSGGAGGDAASVLTSRAAVSRWAGSVAFASDATNLVSSDTNGLRDVFVRDLTSGSTIRASVSTAGVEANGASGGFWGPNGLLGCAISGDGRHVAFTSLATNLVPGDTNGVLDVFVRDRDAGRRSVFDQPGNVRTVLIGQRAGAALPDGRSSQPSLSSDGRFVAFTSEATNLPVVGGDSNGSSDVFLEDRDFDANGNLDETASGGVNIICLSVSTAGQLGNAASSNPSISADARFVAFESDATNLAAGDTNGASDIFVHQVQFALRPGGPVTRVSVSSSGAQGNGGSFNPAAARDGRYVAFDSAASNLVAGDTNGSSDVFVRDRQAGTTVRVSVSTAGGESDGTSYRPSISGDGRLVAFVSYATNLVSGSGGPAPRVYLHDRDADADGIFDEAGAASTTLIGAVSALQPEVEKAFPAISSAGTAVVFPSEWPLSPADSNGAWDVYLQATPLGADSDQDGLLDLWEARGIDYDGDGTTDLTLSGGAGGAGNANPNHKDLFIEVDQMSEDVNGNGRLDPTGFYDAPEDLNGNGVIDARILSAAAQTALINAFAAVPSQFAQNPDGQPGITLHLVFSDLVPFPLPGAPPSFGAWAANPWPQFAQWKQFWLGNRSERSSPNLPNVRGARLLAYRYCIIGDRIGSTTTGGTAELVGNDFMVTLGGWPTPGGTWQEQAGIFLHELGHNLGLLHGGGDAINYKPNYHSVMNYTWTVPAWVPGQSTSSAYQRSWRLDYSLIGWAPLDERSLVEILGINGHPGDAVPFGPLPPRLAPESGSVDWNGDGAMTSAGVVRDINTVVPTSIDPLATPSPGQVLNGFSDWRNLQYPLLGNRNFASGVSGDTTPPGELTHEIVEALSRIDGPLPPQSCCGAAFNVAFSRASVRSPEPFDGIAAGEGDGCAAAGGLITATVPPGGTAPVFVNVVSAAAAGAAGWTLSVEVTGGVDVRDATAAGTAAAPVRDGGLFKGGFEHSEVVDPARNGGRRGAVSAVVLSFSDAVTLPPRGTASVLRLDVGPQGESEGAPAAGRILFADGLMGSGQSVQTTLTVDGETVYPCNLHDAYVDVLLEESMGLFQRGDSNDDGTQDISDGVHILNHLFLGGRAPACEHAADVNGDGRLDISDASYLFNHLFLGGPALPPPYPGCGADSQGSSCPLSACAGG